MQLDYSQIQCELWERKLSWTLITAREIDGDTEVVWLATDLDSLVSATLLGETLNKIDCPPSLLLGVLDMRRKLFDDLLPLLDILKQLIQPIAREECMVLPVEAREYDLRDQTRHAISRRSAAEQVFGRDARLLPHPGADEQLAHFARLRVRAHNDRLDARPVV